jgi:hypothetical protein
MYPDFTRNRSEWHGIITEQNCFMHWAKRLYLELRLLSKPYGAYDVMNSKHIGADMILAHSRNCGNGI